MVTCIKKLIDVTYRSFVFISFGHVYEQHTDVTLPHVTYPSFIFPRDGHVYEQGDTIHGFTKTVQQSDMTVALGMKLNKNLK